jgi:hypothetical protein
MIRDDEIFVVVREEHHLLRTCPCVDCVAERERRAADERVPANKHIKRLSVEAAHVLGFVSHVDPSGSVARRLSHPSQTP